MQSAGGWGNGVEGCGSSNDEGGGSVGEKEVMLVLLRGKH